MWAGPQLAGLVNTGRWRPLRFWQAQGAVIRVLAGSHPTVAYPAALRGSLPAGWEFWTVQALLAITVASLAIAVLKEIDVRASRPVADRRWWQLRGTRPRAFARPRTIPTLLARKPDPERIVIGSYGPPARLLAIAPNIQGLVVAAPRSGKTSGVIIPALLEHQGAAVNTTVRTDVLSATRARRCDLGRVWIWNPFGTQTDGWDPLHGCEEWGHALLVARWLGHAVQLGATNTQEYFDEEAEGLTAPLLHAAALSRQHTIVDVYRWILKREREAPTKLLRKAGASDAIERLENVYAYTERQRDGIIGTAAVQLKAYGNPGAARTASRHGALTPEALFANGEANTLYIVAGREHQQLLAPLVVTLLSSLLYYLSETENRKRARALAARPVRARRDRQHRAAAGPPADPRDLAPERPVPDRLALGRAAPPPLRARRRRRDPRALPSQAVSRLDHRRHTVTELTRLLGQRRFRANQHPEILICPGTAMYHRRRVGCSIHKQGQPPTFYRQRRYYSDAALKALAMHLLGAVPGLISIAIIAAVGLELTLVAAAAAVGVLAIRVRSAAFVSAALLAAVAALVIVFVRAPRSQPRSGRCSHRARCAATSAHCPNLQFASRSVHRTRER